MNQPPPGYPGRPPGYPPPGYPPPGYPPPGYGPPDPYFHALAPKPGLIALRPLSVGDILGACLAVIGRQPGMVLGLAVLAASIDTLVSRLGNLPWHPLAAHPGGSGAIPRLVDRELASLPSTAVNLLTTAFLGGAIALVVAEGVVGRRLSWRQLRRRLRTHCGRIAVLGLIVGVVPYLTLPLFGAGIWFWAILTAAMPALVIEKTSVVVALKRSRELVRGSFWRVWGIRALGVVLGAIAGGLLAVPLIVVLLLVARGSLTVHNSGGSFAISGGLTGITIGANWLVAVLTAPFEAAVAALLYIDQRIRKEGLAGALQQAAAR